MIQKPTIDELRKLWVEIVNAQIEELDAEVALQKAKETLTTKAKIKNICWVNYNDHWENYKTGESDE